MKPDTPSKCFPILLQLNNVVVRGGSPAWWDSRVIPWWHFVPMRNTFTDIYGIMDYFLSGRDNQAERMAMEAADWSGKVLRKVGGTVYWYRLLIELARILDDRRHQLAFVDDLEHPTD